MKDIKSLFYAAKSSGDPKDVSAYTEAVQSLLKDNPIGYMSNLEYIISSNVGISSINEFVERFGLPISAYDMAVESIDKVIRRGTVSGANLSAHKKAKDDLKVFKEKYANCFEMFESVKNDFDDTQYRNTYYSKNSNGIQNRKLAVGMINNFGEAAIPDLIITADSMTGEGRANAINALMEYFYKTYQSNHGTCQLITECAKDVSMTENSQKFLDRIISSNLQTVVNDMRSNKAAMYRESVIMGQTDYQFEYTDEQLQALKDYISFREYQMTSLDGEALTECYKEIMSLYEDLHDIEDLDSSCFVEASNPKKAAVKEIVQRLKDLRTEVKDTLKPFMKGIQPKYSRYEVGYCNKDGKDILSLNGHAKKEISDISDFRSEWLENLFLYVRFITYKKPSIMGGDGEKLFDSVIKVLKTFISSGKIKYARKFTAAYVEYSITFPFTVGKTYVVGDTDMGVFESAEEFFEMFADEFNENWMFSTTNKKTGQAPGYLNKNHDIGYGEDDDPPKKKPASRSYLDDDSDSDSSSTEHSLEDFRRPSASKTPEEDKDEIQQPTQSQNPVATASASSSGNNYYYYTYNNSMNRNSNSFNRSSRDDHSSGKHSHSDNNTSASSDDDSDDDESSEGRASSSQTFNEGIFDIFRKKNKTNNSQVSDTPEHIKSEPIQYVPFTNDMISSVRARLKQLISNFSSKIPAVQAGRYPIYGLSAHIGDHWYDCDGVDIDDEFLISTGVNGVRIYKGKPDFELSFDVAGFDQYDFADLIEKEHPDEYKRLAERYDIESRFDWTKIQWDEVLCGYDKSLEQFTAEMKTIVESDFPMIHGFDFMGDNDSGPIYSGLIDINYLFDGIDMSNIQTLTESYVEGSDKLWEGECRAFSAMFDLDLNKLGDVKSPDKEIEISIGGKKMKFTSSLGNVPGKDQKLSNYTQVPAAVHNFNDNKDRICDDKIGIEKCILHYLKLRDKEFSDMDIDSAIKKYNIKSKKIVFNLFGEIGLTFSCNISGEEEFAILIDQELRCRDGGMDIIFTEAVGDADDQKPRSDHPIRDTFQDIDRSLGKYHQKAKKAVQNAENVGRAAMKPVNRTKNWIISMIQRWKDADENNIKDKMADPHSRNKLYSAIRTSIKYGAITKAGLLFNPLFMALTVYKVRGKSAKEFRIRNEIIGEIKTELKIIEEKKKDADYKRDNKAKYQLMRLENELNKKLLRVGGGKDFAKII